MRFLLLLWLLLPALGVAEIFYWEDENGRKHFSDRKHENAKVISVNAGSGYLRVKRVYDGDTVLLENGVKVRLLGINTPEIAKRDKVADAGGEEAKQWLKRKLDGAKVKLQYDAGRKDKYGRTLAHLFTKDGEHINLQLLREGLAMLVLHPPNLKYAGKLIAAEKQAESEGLGVWGMKAYAAKKVSDYDHAMHKGWQRITGRVSKIKRARKYDYLQLSSHFSLKIAKDAQKLFPGLNSYMGKTVEARGWVNKNKQNYSLFIRHPSAILIKH